MASHSEHDSADFHVLFVCTANQCRSPIAEHLLRAMLGRARVAWTVGSAGTRAVSGRPMHPLAADILEQHGLDTSDWVTRRLDRDLVQSADLVLTAEVAHRQAVVTLSPAAVRYTFTMLQFSQLVTLADPSGRGPLDPDTSDGTDRDRGQQLIRLAESSRARPQSRDAHLLEIADPIGSTSAVFERTAHQTELALQALLLTSPRDVSR